MKKNFLKKLAFTMAFATVFTTLAPAAGVFAASKPSLNVGKKLTLLLGTEREEFDINVKNKVSGSKYEWTTSNKKVATVDKAGVVEGQAVGSAKVTLKITLPTKKTATLSTTVDVKDNIKEVAINNAPKEALKVGQEYDFNRTIVETFGGNTKAHKGAVTRWFLNDTKTATINDSGVFVATEAGEYEVTAKSFQSVAKYNEFLADTTKTDLVTATSETVKVTVKTSIVSAQQVDASTVKVTFDSPIADASKIELSSLVGNTKVKQLVKEVKLDDSKKVATLSVYVPFVSGTTYVVGYTNLEDVQFVAATTKVEDVASIVIEPKEAVIHKETEIKVKLLNKDGVDITTPELLARVSLTSSSDRAYLYNNVLTMSTLSDVTTITAKFHTYTYDTNGNEIITITATASIVCVNVPSVVSGTINAWTLVDNNTPEFAKPVQKLALNDVNYKLFVEVLKTDGSKLSSKDDSLFTFESSNTSVLIADPITGALYPVAQGSAVVVVKYDGAVVGAVTVTIVAKRTVVELNIDSQSLTLSNTLNENKTVTISTKDQLGGNVANADVKVEKVSTNLVGDVTTVGTFKTDANGAVKLVFNAYTKDAGTYTYKVTAGNIVKTISVNVGKPSDTVVRQSLELSATAVDTAIKTGDTTKDVTFKIYDVASNGISKENVTTSSLYTIKVVNPKGTETTVTNSTYSLVSVNDKGEWAKAPIGRYKVTVYKTENSKTTIVDVKYFDVTDTQKAPTLTKVNGAISKLGTELAAINELYEFKLDGTPFTAIDANYAGSRAAGRIYVNSVTIAQEIDGNDLIHTVNVGREIIFQ